MSSWTECVMNRHKSQSAMERTRQLQLERIAELATYGIHAVPGHAVAGSIQIYATNAAKLIRLLNKLTKS